MLPERDVEAERKQAAIALRWVYLLADPDHSWEARCIDAVNALARALGARLSHET